MKGEGNKDAKDTDKRRNELTKKERFKRRTTMMMAISFEEQIVSPIARPLTAQDNTNTEETRSGIRTHDPNV
jgi:hypothetical protein